MSALELFDFRGHQIRLSIDQEGEPWFVAADACGVLGYSRVADALRMLDSDDLGTHFVSGPDGRDRPAQVITESGLYDLIMGSKRPDARPFKRWVTHEVLPAIRKTGSYTIPAQRPALDISSITPRDLALMVIAAEDEKAALSAQVAELEPAASAWNNVATAEGSYSVADAAKMLSNSGTPIGRNRLFQLLHRIGWIYRGQADQAWHVMQSQVETGRLAEVPMSHKHPKTGELVVDAPQVRVTMKGIEKLLVILGADRPLPAGGAS